MKNIEVKILIPVMLNEKIKEVVEKMGGDLQEFYGSLINAGWLEFCKHMSGFCRCDLESVH